MSSSSNLSSGGVLDEKPCIVNNHMGPFIVLYILILIVGLPGNLLSVWAFIQSCRTRVEEPFTPELIFSVLSD